MVGPFLDLTLVAEEELRRTTLPLFYDLLECEYANKGSFKQVGQALVNSISPPAAVKSLPPQQIATIICTSKIKEFQWLWWSGSKRRKGVSEQRGISKHSFPNNSAILLRFHRQLARMCLFSYTTSAMVSPFTHCNWLGIRANCCRYQSKSHCWQLVSDKGATLTIWTCSYIYLRKRLWSISK